MKPQIRCALAVIGTIFFPSPVVAQVPAKLAFQGKLLKPDGMPMTGTVSITFALFANSTPANGEVPLWSESQLLAVGPSGLYSTHLGSVTALPNGIFDGSERYLEVAVAGAPLSPRQGVASVAYALRAGSALVSRDSTLVGNGLGPGTALGVNPASIQRRVTGSCSVGDYLRAVNEDGTVTCGTGSDNYILNQSVSSQSASFAIAGTASVGGNVGIGTLAPLYPLHVVGGGTPNKVLIEPSADNVYAMYTAKASYLTSLVGMRLMNASGQTKAQIVMAPNMTTDPDLTLFTGTGDIILSTSANVGIGTSIPAYPLHMASGAHVTSGGVWTNASSRTYKENIEELDAAAAIRTLEQLKPVTYNYKTDKEEQYAGFIAEDVPELVATRDRKGLSPMDIAAVLVKVAQQQQKEIQELKALLSNRK